MLSMNEPRPISKGDQRRIAGDAHIAIEMLKSIEICAREGRLHPSYLDEKLNTAKACVNFIERFVSDDNLV